MAKVSYAAGRFALFCDGEASAVGTFQTVESVAFPESVLKREGTLSLEAIGCPIRYSTGGLSADVEVVESVSKIDGFALKQSVADATTVLGLVLFVFDPTRNDPRFIKSRAGHLLLSDPGIGGLIILTEGTRPVASWRFERAWLVAIGTMNVQPGSPGPVLLVPETIRRR